MNLGTTFDYEKAIEYGLSLKETLNEIIKLKLSPVRIGLKWNKIEIEPTRYDWSIYDYIINFFYTKKTPIILAIGMKSPRWPEFYVNREKFKSNRSVFEFEDDEFYERLFKFIEKGIRRYRKFKNIKYLQIENEPLLKSGPNRETLTYNLLNKEVLLARSVSDIPILLTDQGLPTTGLMAEYLKGKYANKKKLVELCDCFGLNIFPRFEDKILNTFNYTYKASIFAWRYLLKLFNLAKSKCKECIVTELQAEPWQLGNINYKDANKNKTCKLKFVKDYLRKLKLIGFDTVLIWGTEFHLKCKNEGNLDWMSIYKKK